MYPAALAAADGAGLGPAEKRMLKDKFGVAACFLEWYLPPGEGTLDPPVSPESIKLVVDNFRSVPVPWKGVSGRGCVLTMDNCGN